MKKLSFLIVMLTIIAAVHAQTPTTTFEKISDSLWTITETTYGGGVITKEAYPITNEQLTLDINKRIRIAGLCYIGSFACAAGAGTMAMIYAHKGSVGVKNAGIMFGIGSLGMGLIGTMGLIGDRLLITPDGVILKINKPKNGSTNVQQKTINRP